MPRAEWRVLIADDEPAARRGVRQLLAPHAAYTVVGECRDGAEVLARLDALKPDVVFLDIQMPGADGFDVIRRRTPERMPAVVFLTAWEQHAVRAFEAEAVDYLVKPVSEARFAATMKRLTRRLRSSPPRGQERFVVSTPRGMVIVPLDEIEWIESADNYARLWSGGRSYLLREALISLEPRVSAHGFARAHRRALVRMECVRELKRMDDGRTVALLSGGTRIPVSRRRRARFAAELKARREPPPRS